MRRCRISFASLAVFACLGSATAHANDGFESSNNRVSTHIDQYDKQICESDCARKYPDKTKTATPALRSMCFSQCIGKRAAVYQQGREEKQQADYRKQVEAQKAIGRLNAQTARMGQATTCYKDCSARFPNKNGAQYKSCANKCGGMMQQPTTSDRNKVISCRSDCLDSRNMSDHVKRSQCLASCPQVAQPTQAGCRKECAAMREYERGGSMNICINRCMSLKQDPVTIGD